MFQVIGTALHDPEGKPFLVKGVNINGPGWAWQRDTLQDVALIADTWRFNTVRLCMALGWTWQTTANTDLDAIVRAFTDKGVVVMMEIHDYTGRYPTSEHYTRGVHVYYDLSEFKAWWVKTANAYKDNPYVWFNIMNEPGNVRPEESPSSAQTWFDIHDEIISAIRATGAQNIIVCDEHQWGQGFGYVRQPDDSAIILQGAALNQKHQNIVYALHMYNAWRYGLDRLTQYIRDARERGLCVIIGEYGAGQDDAATHNAAKVMFDACVPADVGRVFWAWDGSDVHRLTNAYHPSVQSGGGWEIDKLDGSTPSNLSWVGRLIWDDNRNALTAPVPGYTLPLLANGGFEQGKHGWSAWGTMQTEQGVSHDGSAALVMPAGATGGAGHGTELRPKTTYRFSAWGKNSVTPDDASQIGVKFALDPAGNEFVHHTLSFTEDVWTQKTCTFTTPDILFDETVFIWKPLESVTFMADDLVLEAI